MKGNLIKSKDAPNIVTNDKENMINLATSNYMEMNNKLIEDFYTVSKKREFT